MIRMVLHLSGYDLRSFLRNRQSRFFTLALPVVFLVIFASVFGGSGHTTQVAGGPISTSAYYVPGIQTQAGQCPTHGTVEGTREIPEMGFPFVVYAIWRAVAQRRPFLCPACGRPSRQTDRGPQPGTHAATRPARMPGAARQL